MTYFAFVDVLGKRNFPCKPRKISIPVIVQSSIPNHPFTKTSLLKTIYDQKSYLINLAKASCTYQWWTKYTKIYIHSTIKMRQEKSIILEQAEESVLPGYTTSRSENTSESRQTIWRRSRIRYITSQVQHFFNDLH